MKDLVVFAHLNPKSFNKAILDTVVTTLQSRGSEVKVRDLYQMGFNPTLSATDIGGIMSGNIPEDIKAEQEVVSWADRVIFVYPLWWVSMPGILKGWIDRVFTYGFAYKVDSTGIVPLLKGKKVLAFTTHGTPASIYEQIGTYDAIAKTIDRGIFEFCGFEVVHHAHFGSVPSTDDATRKEYLAQVTDTLNQLTPAKA